MHSASSLLSSSVSIGVGSSKSDSELLGETCYNLDYLLLDAFVAAIILLDLIPVDTRE
jgi:hypothetical protein